MRATAVKITLAPTVAMALLVCLLPAGPAAALAQDDAPDVRVLTAWEHVAPIDLLTDPRDEGLRRVIALVPDRIRALRGEFSEFEHAVPEPMLELAIDLLSSPMRMIVVHRDAHEGMEGMGVGAGVSFRVRDEGHADESQRRLREGLRMLARGEAPPFEPSQRFPSMDEMQAPFGPVRYGPRRDAEGVWRFEFLLGSLGDPDEAFTLLPEAPLGHSTLARGVIDFRNMQPFINMIGFLAAMASPEAAQAMMQMQRMGLVGPDAVAVHMHIGGKDGWRTMRATARNAAMWRESLGVSSEPLTDRMLGVIPSDATMTIFGMYDPLPWWRMLTAVINADPWRQQNFEEFWSNLNVDPERDLIGAIGPAMGVYLSDATGGGSAMSSVAVASVKDRARLLGAIDRMIAATHASMDDIHTFTGRLRIKRWSDDGIDYAQLQFPGFPVPIEPTLALTESWILLGVTPQAAHAAARQAAGRGDAGLTANVSFSRSAAAIGAAGARQSLSFIDTPRVIDRGYGRLTIIGSALANTVREPRGDKEPGMVVPFFADLRKDARPMVAVTTWDGDDLVMRLVTDESTLASFGGMMGAMRPPANVMTAPMLLGVLLPALGRARSNTQLLRDSAQLRQIHAGAAVYAVNHRDRYPPDFETLIENDHIVPEILESPFGPVPDGRGDYFFNFDGWQMYDAMLIRGYSRAAYFHGRSVNVLFDDGHVESMPLWEFHELLEQPQHKDIDWMLP